MSLRLLAAGEKHHLLALLTESYGMDEDALSALLFPKEEKASRKPLPDCDYLHKELKLSLIHI